MHPKPGPRTRSPRGTPSCGGTFDLAAKRARQLQGGARPVLPTSSKKPTVIAMEEVRRGLVKYEIPGLVPPEPAPEVVL